MSLSWNESVSLLAMIAASDRRTVGEPDIAIWQSVSQIDGWPSLEFAMAAVLNHINENPGVWLQPGHVTARWNQLRHNVQVGFVYEGPTQAITERGEQAVADDRMAKLRKYIEDGIEAYAVGSGVTPRLVLAIDRSLNPMREDRATRGELPQ